jgi:hypothetical protein
MMLNRMTNRARLTRLATPQVERNQGTWLLTHSTAAPNWPVDEWEQLDRFLIFGGERDAHVLRDRIEADGPRVVRRVVELISLGRVVSDEPCLTALAMCATLGNEATRTMAREAAAELGAFEIHQGGERGAAALFGAAAPHRRASRVPVA